RLIFLSLPFLAASEARAFGFEDVDARAKELAAAPFSRASSALHRELQGMSYDQYRDIRCRRNRFLWNRAKLPFEVAFFHPGWLYDQPVKISEVVDDAVREIKFDPESFEYGSNRIDPAKLRELGFAGFRVHYSLNTPHYKDEVLVFLGASYFRALGKSQLYGLSARGPRACSPSARTSARSAKTIGPRCTTPTVSRCMPAAASGCGDPLSIRGGRCSARSPPPTRRASA